MDIRREITKKNLTKKLTIFSKILPTRKNKIKRLVKKLRKQAISSKLFKLFQKQSQPVKIVFAAAACLVIFALVVSSYQIISTIAAQYTWSVPGTIDWDNGSATLDNTEKSGTDLILSNDTLTWTQTNWSGGSGQLAWSDTTKYYTSTYGINNTTEVKLKDEVAANLTSGSGLNTGSNVINDVYDNGTYIFIATGGGLDVITRSSHTSKGYVAHSGGFSSVTANSTSVYAGDADGGVFKYTIADISGSTAEGTAAYTTATSPAIVNNNVNDVYVATISAKVYLAVATDGGATVVNETDATSADSSETTEYNAVFLTTSDDKLYYADDGNTNLQRKDTISGAADGFAATREYSTSSTPAIISATINDLYVTENTSTALATENSVFVATDSGTSVIQEHSTLASSTVLNYYTQGTAGSSSWNSTNHKGALSFDGTDDYLQVADVSTLDISSNDITIEAFFKPTSAFSSDSTIDQYLVSKGEAYQMYLESDTGKLNVELGITTALDTTAARVLIEGNQEVFTSVAVLNDCLYAGQGDGTGDGDVFVYNGKTWATAYDGPEEYIYSLAAFNGYLYAGQGASTGDGDILACDPSTSGDTSVCEQEDWSVVFNSIHYEVIYKLRVLDSELYATVGNSTGDASIYVCEPSNTGNANKCDSGDWWRYYKGSQEVIWDVESYNDKIYAGQGTGSGDGDVLMLATHTVYDSGGDAIYDQAELNGYMYVTHGDDPGDGDISVCDPAGGGEATDCDSILDWSTSYDGSEEVFYSLTVLDGKLYAGQGTGTLDAAVYVCDPTSSGDTDICEQADWAISLSAGENPALYDKESVWELQAIDGKVYAGFGSWAPDGDVYVCDPTATGETDICEGDDWWIYWDSAGSYETVESIELFNSKIYAGFGNAHAGDGDITILNSYGVLDTDNSYAVHSAEFNDKLYVGFGGGLNQSQVYVCDRDEGGDSTLCDNPADWTLAFDGNSSGYEMAFSLAVFNSKLYVGLGSSNNDADVFMCTPGADDTCATDEWSEVYSTDGNKQTVRDMISFNNRMYLAIDNGNNDVIVCNPAGGGEATDCDHADDWSVAYTTGDVYGLEEFNSRLYASMGDGGGSGDVYVCDHGGGGSDPDQCEDGEWTKVFEGGQEVIYDMAVFGDNLYIGQGYNTTDGDVYMCTPGGDSVCATDEWTNVLDTGYETAFSLETLGSNLYVGFGTGSYDGDAYICDPTGGGEATDCDHADDWTMYYDGGQEYVYGFSTHNGKIYAHSGGGTNDADLYYLGGTNDSWDGSQEKVKSLASFNGRLYAGQGSSDSDADIYMCTPATAGEADDCDDASDWTGPVKNLSNYNTVYDLYEFDSKLYASLGGNDNESDIYVCTPGNAGEATHCDHEDDWELYYDQNGYVEISHRFIDFNSKLYVGQEDQAYPAGDLLVLGSSNESYDPGVAIEEVKSLEVFNSKLYAGSGYSNDDGDIYMCDPTGGGDADDCDDDSDWSKAKDLSSDTVNALYNNNGTLYAGLGDDFYEGHLYVCDPTGGGEAGDCDNTDDWSQVWYTAGSNMYDLTSYNNNLVFASSRGANASYHYGYVGVLDGLLSYDHSDYEGVYSIWPFKEKLYIGLGSGDNDADIVVCDPGADDHCDTGDWSAAYSDSSNYNVVNCMAEYKDKLYAGFGWSNYEDDVWVCDPGANDTCDTDEWTLVYSGTATLAQEVDEMIVYKDKLYIAINGDDYEGEVYVCEPGADDTCATDEWSLAYDDDSVIHQAVQSITIFKDKLYIGLGEDAGEGDIYVCDPGIDEICDTDEWTQVYSSPGYYNVLALAPYNGKLYAGLRGTDNMGDIIVCNPGVDEICDTDEWTLSMDGLTYNSVHDLHVYQDKLYAGMGASTGESNIFVCDPTLTSSTDSCETGDWTKYFDGGQEYIFTLGSYKGELYAGQGNGPTDAALYAFGNTRVLESTTSSWSANTWYHLSASYNGTNAKMFVDGTAEATVAETGNLSISSAPITVGFVSRGEETDYLSGLLDELRITDTAEYTDNFTPSSSQLSFSGTNGGLWHFNDGSGTTAVDSSGNSHDFTVSGAAFVQPALTGSSNVSKDVIAAADSSKMWVATNGASADDGAVTQVTGVNTASPSQEDSWTASDSTPNLVDSDTSSISGTIDANNVADIVVGTEDAGVTRFYPGAAASGNLVSSVFDIGSNNVEWGTASWNTTLSGETATVKIRTDTSSDMSGATDWASCDAVTSGNDITANNCVADNERYIQYRIDLSTTDPDNNPQLEDITINATKLWGTWQYDFDAGETVAWDELEWHETTPANTDIKFRIKIADTQAELDGASWLPGAGYYTSTSNDLTSLDNARHMRVQAYLETTVNGTSPTLDDFSVTRTQNTAPSVNSILASMGSTGNVTVALEVKDVDNTTVDVTMQYYDGNSWESPTTTSGWIGSGQTISDAYASKTITWDIGDDVTGTYIEDTYKVRVTLDDNESHSNTTTSTSAAFTVDTIAPQLGATPLTINSGAATTNDRDVTLTISATDDSALLCQYSNDGVTYGTQVSADGSVSDSGNYETCVAAKAWTLLAGSEGTKTVYLNVKDAYGNNAASLPATDTITYDTSAVNIPTDLAVIDASDAGLEDFNLALRWTTLDEDENSGFDGYRIERSEDAEEYSSVATLNSITDSGYLNTNLEQDQTYYYRLKSLDTAGNLSDPSTVAFGTPAGDDDDPPDLSGEAPVAACTITSCTVAWTTDESSTSCVELGEDTDYGSIVCDLDYVLEHEVSALDLTGNTTYHYRVISVDANGNKATGTDYTMTTQESGDDTDPPDLSGEGPIVSPSDATASIAWVTDEKADSFVEFGSTNEYGSLQGSETLATDHIITIVGLESQKTYHYRVKSTDAAGNTTTTDDDTFTTTLPAEANDPPEISDIESQAPGVSSTAVTISWTTDTYSTSQVLYGTTEKLGTESEEDTTLNKKHYVTIADLSPATTYYYQVRSEDTYGNVTTSDVLNFTTSAVVIVTEPTISGIETQAPGAAATSITIIWTTDTDTTSQVIYGTSSDLGQTSAEDETLTKKHFFTITGLIPDTKYYYKVKSEDAHGNVTLSDLQTFTTSRQLTGNPQISGVQVTDITLNSAIISWNTFQVTTSNLQYGPTISYGSTLTDESLSLTTIHVARLSGLASGTAYHFRIYSKDADGKPVASDDYVFNTLALPVVSGITATDIQDRQATVSWATNTETSGQVEYGAETSYGLSQGSTEPKTSHSVTLVGLEPDTLYHFRIVARDSFSNQGTSGDNTVRTLRDANPPQISSIAYEVSTISGTEGKVQAIVSWVTDELATSQVLYNQGIAPPADENAYTVQTTEDPTLNNSHVVIISDLNPSNTYHLRVKSADQLQNSSVSEDYSLLTPPQTRSVLGEIIASLEARFIWLSKLKDIFGF